MAVCYCGARSDEQTRKLMHTMTNHRNDQTITFATSIEGFRRALEGKNRSASTIRSYLTDVSQLVDWLEANTVAVTRPDQVTKADLTEYLAHLSRRGLSGVTRARKLASLREYFRYLEEHELIAKSPAVGIETPKKEKPGRTYLRPDEYTKLLSLAGANPRDYAIFQVFLQTGVRVSELCALRLDDIDLVDRVLSVRAGKGMVARDIELEKKAAQALKTYLASRPDVLDDHLFLNRDGEPLSDRGVRKLVAKYLERAGITKKVSPHSLRHTFATYKAERGVSPFQLQQWLGHQSLDTTQIYVHMGRKNARKAMEATSL